MISSSQGTVFFWPLQDKNQGNYITNQNKLCSHQHRNMFTALNETRFLQTCLQIHY